MNKLTKFGEFLAEIAILKLEQEKTASLSKYINRNRVRQLIDALSRKHPEWGQAFVRKNVELVAKYAPRALLDASLVEQILKKIYMYGGTEPSLIKELVEMDRIMRTSLGW